MPKLRIPEFCDESLKLGPECGSYSVENLPIASTVWQYRELPVAPPIGRIRSSLLGWNQSRAEFTPNSGGARVSKSPRGEPQEWGIQEASASVQMLLGEQDTSFGKALLSMKFMPTLHPCLENSTVSQEQNSIVFWSSILVFSSFWAYQVTCSSKMYIQFTRICLPKTPCWNQLLEGWSRLCCTFLP